LELYRNLWLAHFNCEKETEILRQRLLKNPFFDLQKSFKAIDTRNNGFIKAEDVSIRLTDFYRWVECCNRTGISYHSFRSSYSLLSITDRFMMTK
jgi:hypothetical protein